MARITLNDKSARRAAPETGQFELWDNVLPGFGLRIAAGGARTYFIMKRLNGKLARRTVGKAPPPQALRDVPLAVGEYWPHEARERARRMMADMAAGVDPRDAERAAAKAESEAQTDTFKAVADRYLSSSLKGGGQRLRTKDELERKLKVDLKDWHDEPIASIRRRDIQALVDQKAEIRPIAANRLLSFIKRVFRWAVSKDIIDADPAASVSKPGEESVRKRFLSDDEIRLFWRACDRLDVDDEGESAGSAGRLFKLALVTAQRRGEVAGMRRSEQGTLQYKVRRDGRDVTVTGDAWLLPAARTKRGSDHTVPLSPLAKSLIDGAPVLTIGEKKFDCILASGARGDQPVSGWSRYKARLDSFMAQEMAKEADEEFDAEKHCVEPWHIHDLRATAATIMESRLQVPTRVISRILNHAEGDGRSMTARYVRHSWDPEAAEALNNWADELRRIVGLNVVKIDQGVAS